MTIVIIQHGRAEYLSLSKVDTGIPCVVPSIHSLLHLAAAITPNSVDGASAPTRNIPPTALGSRERGGARARLRLISRRLLSRERPCEWGTALPKGILTIP